MESSRRNVESSLGHSLFELGNKIGSLAAIEVEAIEKYSLAELDEGLNVGKQASKAETPFKIELQDARNQLDHLSRVNKALDVMKKYLKAIPDLHTRQHYEQEVVMLQSELDQLHDTGERLLEYAPRVSKIAQAYLRGEGRGEIAEIKGLSEYFHLINERAEARYKLLTKTLSFVGHEIKKNYAEHPYAHKLSLVAIILASVGAASWLWIWKALEQPISVNAVITASPTFTPLNILLSILIFAGLIYSFKHLEKRSTSQ